MVKNYAFLASAAFAFKGILIKQNRTEADRNTIIKESCKVAGVLTGSMLFLGIANTGVKKALAFGVLTTTSLISYHLGVSTLKTN
jgi:hypothetical protein